ncbi:MAG: hypothetical protein ACKV22_38750 [Bryobacteraceae bacterium]
MRLHLWLYLVEEKTDGTNPAARTGIGCDIQETFHRIPTTNGQRHTGAEGYASDRRQ